MQFSDNARGVAIMCGAMAAFVLNDTAVKAATATVPLFEVIAIRGVLSVAGLMLIGWRARSLQWRMSRRDAGLVSLRTGAEVAASVLFLTSLVNMPLANLSAIMQFLPRAYPDSAW